MEKFDDGQSSLKDNPNNMISDNIDQIDAYPQVYYENSLMGLNSNFLMSPESYLQEHENVQQKKPSFFKPGEIEFSDFLNLKGSSQSQFSEEIYQFELLSCYYRFLEMMIVKPQHIPLLRVSKHFNENTINESAGTNQTQKYTQMERQGAQQPLLDCKIDGNINESQYQHQYSHKIFSQVDFMGIANQRQCVTQNLKMSMIEIRNKLEGIRQLLQRQMKLTKNNQCDVHRCKLCGQEFSNGRKLGGHMSRKHPGSSKEYMIKKQIYRNKLQQRKRRMYFKSNKNQNKDNIPDQ